MNYKALQVREHESANFLLGPHGEWRTEQDLCLLVKYAMTYRLNKPAIGRIFC